MKRNRYLIDLQRRQSIIALISGSIVSAFTFAAIIMGILENPATAIVPERGGTSIFRLFTVNSNLLAAVGAFLMIPFAVEGIKKKQFRVPKWIMVLQYSGTVCVTLTLIVTLSFILPKEGLRAFYGMDFCLHLICPIMSIVLFCFTETDRLFTFKDTLITLLPSLCYGAVYGIMVFGLKGSYGSWRDMYHLGEYVPFWISALVMVFVTLGISMLYQVIHNKLMLRRFNKMKESWGDSVCETEVKIEVFGLGNYMGNFVNDSDISIPFDILNGLSKKTINIILKISEEEIFSFVQFAPLIHKETV